MTQPNTTQTTDNDGKPVVTSTSDTGQAPEVKPGDVKSLPQWAQDIISSVRAEAANWRTQLREAQDALGKAKTPEDVAKATEEIERKNKELERELLVERIANKHGLPDDLKSRLKGDDEKALEDDAKALAKFAPKKEEERVDPDNLSGGLDPNDSSDAFDPVAEAKKARATRY